MSVRRRKAGRGLETLESRQLLTVTITPITDVNVPADKTVNVPVSSTDSNGGAITYTVDSSNPNVSAYMRTGDEYLDLKVANYGDLVFQLYDDTAPNTVARITQLVQEGFYNGLSFDKLVPGSLLETATQNVTTGPPLTAEFDSGTLFTGSGELAIDNSAPNASGASFFVTLGADRSLDFNDTIFGQLVSGQSVLTAIGNASVDGSNMPTQPITITSASIVPDITDSVIQIQAPDGTGSSLITLTATSDSGETVTKTFNANFAPDTYDDPPYLSPISDDTSYENTPYNISVSATDLQPNDTLVYTATETDGLNSATVQIDNQGNLTVTPAQDFTGTIPIQVTVAEAGATDRGAVADPRSIQSFNLTVTPVSITTTATPVTATAGVSETHLYGSIASNLAVFDVENNVSITVDFGDGSTGPATLVSNGSGGTDIVATHQYASAGAYTTSLLVTGPGTYSQATPSTATVIAAGSAPLTIGVSATTTTFGTDPTTQNNVEIASNTIVVTNPGTTDMTNVVLTQTVPTGMWFNTASITPTSTAGGTLTFALGDIPAGGSVTVTTSLSLQQNGFFDSQISASGDSGAAISQTAIVGGNTLLWTTAGGPVPIFVTTGKTVIPPTNGTSPTGSNSTTGTKHWVKAPAGVNIHAITLTSKTFAAILGGKNSGLAAIMNNFNKTGNVKQMDAGLTKLVKHIPYGVKNLLPVLKQTISTTGLSPNKRDPNGVVAAQLKNAIVSYLNSKVGVDINVVKSKSHHTTDHLLNYNGKV